MIHPTISGKLDLIREILRKNHVVKAYMFGSVVTARFRDDSDIDILVSLDNTLDLSTYGNSYWNILFELEYVLNREIDLLTLESLSNPYLIEEINATKVEIV